MTNAPITINGADRPSRWLITCDHATSHVPKAVSNGDLGLPATDMGRHIAYDIGAAGVTRHLAHLMDAPAILSEFSRLVIDPNRGEDDPTLMMRLYDGTIIPANRNADEAEVERRLIAYHRPYHTAYAALAAQHTDRAICAVHSFTPRLNSRAPRPWQIGILFADDDRLARPLIALLQAEPDLDVGINQPYLGHLPGDAIDRHALQKNRPNALLELRQDLIETPQQQLEWAERLAPILKQALTDADL
jgi:predicted N-formylglutamate amidohydrolase